MNELKHFNDLIFAFHCIRGRSRRDEIVKRGVPMWSAWEPTDFKIDVAAKGEYVFGWECKTTHDKILNSLLSFASSSVHSILTPSSAATTFIISFWFKDITCAIPVHGVDNYIPFSTFYVLLNRFCTKVYAKSVSPSSKDFQELVSNSLSSSFSSSFSSSSSKLSSAKAIWLRLEEKLAIQNKLSRSACIIFSNNDIFCDEMEQQFNQRRFQYLSYDIVNPDTLIIGENDKRKILDEYQVFLSKHGVSDMSIVCIYAAKTMRETLPGLNDYIQNPSGIMHSAKSVTDTSLQLLLDKTSKMGRDNDLFQGTAKEDAAVDTREVARRNIALLDSLKKTWQGPGDKIVNISSDTSSVIDMSPKWLFRTKFGAQVFIILEMKTNLLISPSFKRAITNFLLFDEINAWKNYASFFFPYFEYKVRITDAVANSAEELIKNLRFDNDNDDAKQVGGNNMTVGFLHVPCSSTRQVKTLSEFVQKTKSLSPSTKENDYLVAGVLFQLFHTYLTIPTFNLQGLENDFMENMYAYLLISLIDLTVNFPFISSSSSSSSSSDLPDIYFAKCPCYHFQSSSSITFSNPYLLKFAICSEALITGKLTAQQKLTKCKSFLKEFSSSSSSSSSSSLSSLISKLLVAESTLAFFNEFDAYFKSEKDHIKVDVNDIFLSISSISSSSSSSSISSISSSKKKPLEISSSSLMKSPFVFVFVREVNIDENIKDASKGSNMIFLSNAKRKMSCTYEFFYFGEEDIDYAKDIKIGNIISYPHIELTTTTTTTTQSRSPFDIQLYINQFDVALDVIKPNSFFFCTLSFALSATSSPDAKRMAVKVEINAASAGSQPIFTEFFCIESHNVAVLLKEPEAFTSLLSNPLENNRALIFTDKKHVLQIGAKYYDTVCMDPNFSELFDMTKQESVLENILPTSEFQDQKLHSQSSILNALMRDPNAVLKTTAFSNLDKLSFIRFLRQVSCQTSLLLNKIFQKLDGDEGGEKQTIAKLMKLQETIQSTRYAYLLTRISQKDELYEQLKRWMTTSSQELQKRLKQIGVNLLRASFFLSEKDTKLASSLSSSSSSSSSNASNDDDNVVDKEGRGNQKESERMLSAVCVFPYRSEVYAYIASKTTFEIRLYQLSTAKHTLSDKTQSDEHLVADDVITHLNVAFVGDSTTKYTLAAFCASNRKLTLMHFYNLKYTDKYVISVPDLNPTDVVNDFNVSYEGLDKMRFLFVVDNRRKYKDFTYNVVNHVIEKYADSKIVGCFASSTGLQKFWHPLEAFVSKDNGPDEIQALFTNSKKRFVFECLEIVIQEQKKVLYAIVDEYTKDVIYTVKYFTRGKDTKQLKFRFQDSSVKHRRVNWSKQHYSGKNIRLVCGQTVDFIVFRTTKNEIFVIYIPHDRYQLGTERWEEVDVVDLSLLEQPIETLNSDLSAFDLSHWVFGLSKSASSDSSDSSDIFYELNPYTLTFRGLTFFDITQSGSSTGGNGKFSMKVLKAKSIVAPNSWKQSSLVMTKGSNVFANQYKYVSDIIPAFPKSFPILSITSDIAKQLHAGYDHPSDMFFYNRCYQDLQIRLIGGYMKSGSSGSSSSSSSSSKKYQKLFNNPYLSLKYKLTSGNYQQFRLLANFFYDDNHDDKQEEELADEEDSKLSSVLIMNLFFFAWEKVDLNDSRVKFQKMSFNLESPHYDAIVVLGNDNSLHIIHKSWLLRHGEALFKNPEFVHKHLKYIRLVETATQHQQRYAVGERVIFDKTSDQSTPFNSFEQGTYQFDDPYNRDYGYVCQSNGVLIRTLLKNGFIFSIEKRLVPWLEVGSGKEYDIETDGDIKDFHTSLIKHFFVLATRSSSSLSLSRLYNYDANAKMPDTISYCREVQIMEKQICLSLLFSDLKNGDTYNGKLWYSFPFLSFDGVTNSFYEYFDPKKAEPATNRFPLKDFQLQDGKGFFIRDCGKVTNERVTSSCILFASFATNYKDMEHTENESRMHKVPIRKFHKYDPPVIIVFENEIDLNLQLLDSARIKSTYSNSRLSKLTFYSETMMMYDDDDDDDKGGALPKEVWDYIPNVFNGKPKYSIVSSFPEIFVRIPSINDLIDAFRICFCFYRFALPDKNEAVLTFFFIRYKSSLSSSSSSSSLWKSQYVSVNDLKKMVAASNPVLPILLQVSNDDAMAIFRDKNIFVATDSIIRLFGVNI